MTCTRLFAVAVVVAVLFALGTEGASAAPLKEQGLNALIVAGFDDDEITAKVERAASPLRSTTN